ncbi:indole-3-acetaldehyde oxidase isoform X2 [Amborella trichopoda]|uniref:indole-3-acetaldehyde oxidase isoform X2 n=1 Tax=Amborella trichopoda TaxID=13333 RepID=UPI0009BE5F25|nr:indole-3-acetaldehyde oxidase isoform X2 [Amborella trichopoda]|eukprot:XP_020525175.1 indole-3-acetaldehyde oxidase isoform X2 [Amborella trichopoda]
MKQRLVFAVNGEKKEVFNIHPSTTLLEFLRTETPYKGAKLGCGEGGCGACVVLLSKYNPVNGDVEDFTVNSCLTLLCSLDGCSITTSEGLGNCRDGYHSVHQRIAGFHASQCGFCTPGMSISLFSALINADKTSGSKPPNGFSKLTVSEAERAIAGNLCRCTGYRPIIDTCKSFCRDVDMEDLGFNSFSKKGEPLDVNKLPPYNQHKVCTFPEFLKPETKLTYEFSERNLNLVDKNGMDELRDRTWASPSSMRELLNVLASEANENGAQVKIVAGNTSSGIYKRPETCCRFIDIRHIPELLVIRRDDLGIEIGACVTISKAIKALDEEVSLEAASSLIFEKIANHMNIVASKFIRNTATLGGNLIIAQRDEFPSDIATILLGAGSSVTIQTPRETLSLTLEEFLETPPCDSQTLLISIQIPSWNQFHSPSKTNGRNGSEREKRLMFETYRAAPYPLGGALAYLNAAFMAEVSVDESNGDLVLGSLRLAFGAYGTRHAMRAKKVEEFLEGKSLTPEILLEAIQILKMFIFPKEGIRKSGYRSSLAVGFLFDFLSPLVKGLAEPKQRLKLEEHDLFVSSKIQNKSQNGYTNAVKGDSFDIKHHNGVTNCNSHKEATTNGGSISVHGQSAQSYLSKKPTSFFRSMQMVEVHGDYGPVGLPTKKVATEIQASGEAIYVDDIPSPKDCLYGAFVYSQKPFASVKHIEFDSLMESPGVVSFVSVKDIPKGGENIGSESIFGKETLFADDLTEYAGQPIGVLIAETQKHAKRAADQVKVYYDTSGLRQPILSVEEAVAQSSFFEVPEFFCPKQVGDFSKALAEADHKILSSKVEIGSQYYFYMETQTALAIPDEDNCITVYSSTQVPETTQVVVAKCLGVPEHNVRVITRRVGGGFGGKAFRSIPVAVACALAAHKLRRPVRMYLDRQTDMIMTGGRHPIKVTYTVGFNSDGKITALHFDALIDAGISPDTSPIMPKTIVNALKKYNWGSLSFDFKVCKTNFPSKSAMRAPGDAQGSFIAETIIEHVASSLSMDANSIREKNLHTFSSLNLFYGDSVENAASYTLPLIMDKLVSSSCLNQRIQTIQQFNSMNRWKKREISLLPIIYEVSPRPTPGRVSILNDGSIVVEVGGVEIGQGLWTKVTQMTAFTLGQLWKKGNEEILEKIRVVQSDTISLVQGGYTAGSTTSESSCAAVGLACNILVERLAPIKANLLGKMQLVSWDALVRQAHMQAVNLSANAYWTPDMSSSSYLNFGAAASEVEIDLLTGATTILRTDITYDCGRSLNPAVDLGQIEGAFVQGIGFFTLEEHVVNSEGMVVSDGTWTYKIPNIDTIPKQFNVEFFSSGHHKKRVLSSKVHCAMRGAIKEARKELQSYKTSSNEQIGEDCSAIFRMDTPATMDLVKRLCGLENVERYLQSLVHHH